MASRPAQALKCAETVVSANTISSCPKIPPVGGKPGNVPSQKHSTNRNTHNSKTNSPHRGQNQGNFIPQMFPGLARRRSTIRIDHCRLTHHTQERAMPPLRGDTPLKKFQSSSPPKRRCNSCGNNCFHKPSSILHYQRAQARPEPTNRGDPPSAATVYHGESHSLYTPESSTVAPDTSSMPDIRRRALGSRP